MKDGKLLQLLRTLSMAERQRFGEFLHSPFHNKREDCRRFWSALEGMKEGQLPEKERLYQKSYPKSPYDDQRFRLLQNALLGLLESFLVLREFGQNKLEQELLLIKEYRKRGLGKHQRGARRRAEKQLEGLKTADALRVRHELEQESFNLEVLENQITGLSYQPLLDQWDEYYLAKKLRQACSAKSYGSVAGTPSYDFGLLDVLFDRLDWERYLSVPAISLYYHGYWMLVRPEEEAHFTSFKHALLQHGESFPLAERKDLFMLAANYCTRKYNEGRGDYTRELNEINKVGLAAGAFLVDFSRFRFRNIVITALVAGDVEWAEQFMEDYQTWLPHRYRESMVSYSRALLEFQGQNYGRALQLLQKAEYRDLVLNLSAKAVLIKIYYETGEDDLLDAHLAAMRIFIRRQKNPSYQVFNFQQLVIFAQRLLELNPYDPAAKARLLEEVEAAKAVSEKEWLLRMLKEGKSTAHTSGRE
jgi:hypothetical protein